MSLRNIYITLILTALYPAFTLFAAAGPEESYPAPPSAELLLINDPDFKFQEQQPAQTHEERSAGAALPEAAAKEIVTPQAVKEDPLTEKKLAEQDRKQQEFAEKKARLQMLKTPAYGELDAQVNELINNESLLKDLLEKEGVPAAATAMEGRAAADSPADNPETAEEKRLALEKAEKEKLAADIAEQERILRDRTRIEKDEKEIFAEEIAANKKNSETNYLSYVLRSALILADIYTVYVSYKQYSEYMQKALNYNQHYLQNDNTTVQNYRDLADEYEAASASQGLFLAALSVTGACFAYTVLDMAFIHAAFPVTASAGFDPQTQTASVMINGRF